jgi:hypothetical protein
MQQATPEPPTLSDQERPLTEKEKDILHMLSFSGMEDGKADIRVPETYGNTFRRLFDDTNSGSGFAQWLTQGDRVIWISGEMGSGKSVIIKAISDSPQTTKSLQ